MLGNLVRMNIELTDETLVERIGAKDSNAMTELYRRYEKPLRHFLAQRLRHAQDAEDLLQETMTSVWRFANGYRGESSAKSWVYTIARNLAYKFNHSRVQSVDAVELDTVIETIRTENDDQIHTCHSKRFLDCLSRLSESNRNSLMLTYFVGCTLQEVASIEKCSVNTIKKRNLRARSQLLVEYSDATAEHRTSAAV